MGAMVGFLISPEIFAECKDSMQIVREAIFGAVMGVLILNSKSESFKG